jgi:hypothetical protein
VRRRDFNLGSAAFGGALLAGCGAGSHAGESGKTGGISEQQMLQDARNAAPYRKPKGVRNGFDGANMNQVMEVTRHPAVRVKLEMSGKPQAAQLPDSVIVVAGFVEPPEHKQSRCTIQYSKDNGRTYSDPVVTSMEGRTLGFKALKDGALVLCHGGDGGPAVSRSTDGGRTWSTAVLPRNIVPGAGSMTFGECQGPVEMPDGTLLVHLARTVGKYEWDAYIIRSKDGGKSWGDPTRAPTETDSDEISYALLPSGQVMGVTRSSAAMIRREHLEDKVPGGKDAPLGSEAGDAAYQFFSSDQGRTWTHPVPTGLGVLQAAGAYPMPLRDGRVLLLYGNRIFPYGAQAVGSRDGGRTWNHEHPILLAWHSWSGYCGHPRSVQLQDGSILTGYYTHRIDVEGDPPPDIARNAPSPHHNGADTGEVLRWRVPDNWPPA